jgi:hypothetical protein
MSDSSSFLVVVVFAVNFSVFFSTDSRRPPPKEKKKTFDSLCHHRVGRCNNKTDIIRMNNKKEKGKKTRV